MWGITRYIFVNINNTVQYKKNRTKKTIIFHSDAIIHFGIKFIFSDLKKILSLSRYNLKLLDRF